MKISLQNDFLRSNDFNKLLKYSEIQKPFLLYVGYGIFICCHIYFLVHARLVSFVTVRSCSDLGFFHLKCTFSGWFFKGISVLVLRVRGSLILKGKLGIPMHRSHLSCALSRHFLRLIKETKDCSPVNCVYTTPKNLGNCPLILGSERSSLSGSPHSGAPHQLAYFSEMYFVKVTPNSKSC